MNRRTFLQKASVVAAGATLAGCANQTPPVTQPVTQPSNQQWLNDLAFAQQVVNFASVVIPFLPLPDQVIASAALKLTTDGITAAENAIANGETPATIAQLIAIVVRDAKALMVSPQIVTAHATVVAKAHAATLMGK